MPDPAQIPAIQIEALTKSFGTLEVLAGVSLTAWDHDVVAILGSSGSGKSTFLRCMNMLETPDSGQIRIEGELVRMVRRGGVTVPEDRRQVQRIRRRVAMQSTKQRSAVSSPNGDRRCRRMPATPPRLPSTRSAKRSSRRGRRSSHRSWASIRLASSPA